MGNGVVLGLQGLGQLFALLNKSTQSISYLLTIDMLLQYLCWNICICQHQTVLSSFQTFDEPILLENILLKNEEAKPFVPFEFERTRV